MKRITYLFLAGGFAAMVACGPSAEEKAAIEKAKQDSIAAAQKMIDDSIATVNAAAQKAMQDSMNMAMEKAKQDSIAASEVAIKKKARPKTNAQKIQENKKIAKKEKG
jgi:hypothetical protein